MVEPNLSTQGIAVLANTLSLNGGAIKSASSNTDANLSHSGLGHDSSHKVDWRLSATAPAAPTSTPEPTPEAAPTVTGVAVSSDAGDDDTYAMGETISVRLTFSEAVDVTGTPQLKIDMDPAEWGEKDARYASGSGTARLTFKHNVVEPNFSSRGIAVLANTLALNGGTIKSASSNTDANLSHSGLGHDASHKVDWRLSATAPGAPTSTPEPTPAPAPSVSAVAVSSDAGDDDTYAMGETIRVTLTFSEAVDVTGTPQLKIDMDPAEWGEKDASYESGSGTASLTFKHEVVEPNLSTQGIAALANTLALNGGTIKSASSQTDAELSHTGLDHDASHKVDWRLSPPPAATSTTTPVATSTTTPAEVAPTVTKVEITSDAGSDNTYAQTEVIQATVTFSEPVSVTLPPVSYDRTHGGPRLLLDKAPGNWGGIWAKYQGGSGTASLTFAYSVKWRDNSQGIAVVANSLSLDGGTIKSVASWADADLSHEGLDHDANHKVEWHRTLEAAVVPTVVSQIITSHPRNGDTYALGETIRLRLVFNEWVYVSGEPRLKIDLDPGDGGEVWAEFESSGLSYQYFGYTVVDPDVSTQGVAVLADTLELNGGSIRSRASSTNADLSHGGLDHDANHKVDGVKKTPGKINPDGNDAPVCTGSAERAEVKYAPPLFLAQQVGLDCGDADGDELTFTVTSDPAGVAKQMSYDSSINRVWFQALGHCDLEAIVPELPHTFTTTVTVTATDPHGASATGHAYFRTWYDTEVNGLPTGCPNLVSASGSGKKLTLTFDVELDRNSAPAADDFVVKVDGEAVALAETGAVEIDYTSVKLTLAEAVSGSPTVTVSYTPGDNPIQDRPLWDAVKAEAFEDYPVNWP